jgi:hypothetical protein
MTRKIQLFALLSSTALSSLAYATEEILWVLMLAGSAVIHLSWRIALLVAGFLVLIALSYRQIMQAYPNPPSQSWGFAYGGARGAYFIVGEKLGRVAGFVVGVVRLMVYLLTIGVSISAAVAALVSLVPALLAWRLVIALMMIGLLTLINLRGWREVGKIVWPLTYFFVVLVLLVIGIGLTRLIMGQPPLVTPWIIPPVGAVPPSGWLYLRAFAVGCIVITGIDAMDTRRMQSWVVGILMGLFLGITLLSQQLGAVPPETQTILSQMGRAAFGIGPLYYSLQAATVLILLLAAHVNYANFCNFAKWMTSGRLSFTNSSLILGLCVASLVILFGATVHTLIRLLVLALFVSFILLQVAMRRHR